ncbi:hypothetical protein [Streptomyces bicolor]|uniref:hypothetical protein n=1 Tax=Streptomyces bicolor TaxID=66874 RepID=UPI0004E14011|nr:hypothetical protein [Streptomyces bicolor]
MPLFRRALWPHDHRDELVAGALVGAVVVVLGYASGIGAPATASDPTAAPPPAATAPTSPNGTAPPGAPGDASGADAGGAAGTGALPVTGVHYPGDAGGPDHTGHTGTSGGTGAGHTGHGASPTPPDPTSPASPAPSTPGTTPPSDDDATCEDGEVRLARPLLTGLTEPVFGLLNPTAEASPTAQPSPCIGLAPLPSLLGGITPSPEATP